MSGGLYYEIDERRPTETVGANEGFQRTTYYESNNSYNTNTYTISNGQLTVRSKGDTSWSDSKYDKTRICDDAQTHRFLRKNLSDLNTDGID